MTHKPAVSTEGIFIEKKKKILRRLTLVSGLFIFVVITTQSYLNNKYMIEMHGIINRIFNHEQALLKNTFKLLDNSRQRTIILQQVIDEPDPFIADDKIINMQDNVSGFLIAKEQIENIELSVEEDELFTQYKQQITEIYQAQQEVISLVKSGRHKDAKQLINSRAIPLQNQSIATLYALIKETVEHGEHEVHRETMHKMQSHNILKYISIFSSLFVVFITIASWLFIKRVFKNIQATEEELNLTLQYLESQKMAMDHHDIVSIADVNGSIIYANDKFCEVSQYSREELIGKNHRIIKSGCHAKSVFDDMWQTISAGKIWKGEICNQKKDGSLYWVDTTITPFLDENGIPYQYIAVRTDISNVIDARNLLITNQYRLEQQVEDRTRELKEANEHLQEEIDARKKLEGKLKLQAETDELTGIYNRRKLNQLINNEISRCKRYGNNLSIILFDIDHFKSINDTFGHNTGDLILKEITALATQNLRNTDIFARWGGEEFIIACTECNLEQTIEAAEKLRALFANTRFTESLHVTCSFGISTYQENDTVDSLIARADEQLYHSKKMGRNKVS